VTLYLKTVVGGTRYLIAAAQVRDVAPAEEVPDALVVDCRLLFGTPVDRQGHHLAVEAGTGEPVDFVVDVIDGLVELDDDSFRTLPPIGRFGAAIDAVSVRADGEMPALRLSIGAALLDQARPVERVD